MQRIIGFMIFLFISVNFTFSTAVIAGKKEERQCISLINQQTVALVARDWENLESLGNAYLQSCKEMNDPESTAMAYHAIAIANEEMKKPKLALDASESCIKTYSAIVGCHLIKVISLWKLGKKNETLKALDITEQIAKRNLERNLIEPYSKSDKKAYEAMKKESRAILDFADEFRKTILNNDH